MKDIVVITDTDIKDMKVVKELETTTTTGKPIIIKYFKETT